MRHNVNLDFTRQFGASLLLLLLLELIAISASLRNQTSIDELIRDKGSTSSSPTDYHESYKGTGMLRRRKSMGIRKARAEESNSDQADNGSEEDRASKPVDRSSTPEAIEHANRASNNVNRRIDTIRNRVNQIETMIADDHPHPLEKNLTPSSSVPLTYDVAATSPDTTDSSESRVSNENDEPRIGFSHNSTSIPEPQTQLSSASDLRWSRKNASQVGASKHEEDQIHDNSMNENHIDNKSGGQLAIDRVSSASEHLGDYEKRINRHSSGTPSYSSGTLETSQSQASSSILMPEWSPSENYQFFNELNAKNHDRSEYHINGPRSGNRFQNMTIVNTENDLAKSYSNLQPIPNRAPQRNSSPGVSQYSYSAFNYGKSSKDQQNRAPVTTTHPSLNLLEPQDEITEMPIRWPKEHRNEGLDPPSNELDSRYSLVRTLSPTTETPFSQYVVQGSKSIYPTQNQVDNEQVGSKKIKITDRSSTSNGDIHYSGNLDHRSTLHNITSDSNDSHIPSTSGALDSTFPSSSSSDSNYIDQSSSSNQLDHAYTRPGNNNDQYVDQNINFTNFSNQYQASNSDQRPTPSGSVQIQDFAGPSQTNYLGIQDQVSASPEETSPQITSYATSKKPQNIYSMNTNGIDLNSLLQRYQRQEQLLMAARQNQPTSRIIDNAEAAFNNYRRNFVDIPNRAQPIVGYPIRTPYTTNTEKALRWSTPSEGSMIEAFNIPTGMGQNTPFETTVGFENTPTGSDSSSPETQLYRSSKFKPVFLQDSQVIQSNLRDSNQRLSHLDVQPSNIIGVSSYFDPSSSNLYTPKGTINLGNGHHSYFNAGNNLRSPLYSPAAAMQIPSLIDPTASNSNRHSISQSETQQSTETKGSDSTDSSSLSGGMTRRRNYLNSLFKPSASSRYYYAPTLLSPITIASPTSLHSLYAPPISASAGSASDPSLNHIYSSSPQTTYMIATPTVTADAARQQYQLALAQAATMHQPHYMSATDTEMSESSLVPISPESGDMSASSSQSSSEVSESTSSNSSSGKSSGKGVVPWTNIASLLLGVLPFGILVASLLPAVSMTGRKKRELVEFRGRNYSDAFQWRPRSKVLAALAENLIDHNQKISRRSTSVNMTNGSLLTDILNLKDNTRASSEHRSLDTFQPEINATTLSSPLPTTTPIPLRFNRGVVAKLKKVTRNVINKLNPSTSNNLKLKHRSSTFSDISPLMLFKSPDFSSIIRNYIINRMINQTNRELSNSHSFLKSYQSKDHKHTDQPVSRKPETQPTLAPQMKNQTKSLVEHQKTIEDNLVGTIQSNKVEVLNSSLVSKHGQVVGITPKVEIVVLDSNVDVSKTNVSVEPQNNGYNEQLEVCLNQFLCRLASKLIESIKYTVTNGQRLKVNTTLEAPEPEQIEKVTKSHIHKVLDQIKAQDPFRSLIQKDTSLDDALVTDNRSTVQNTNRAKKKVTTSKREMLDKLYKNAVDNRCSSSYKCMELVEFQKLISMMKLRFD